VRHIDMPATPQRVWAAINEAKGGQMGPAQMRPAQLRTAQMGRPG
jgi:hypothetical protein